MEPDCTRRQALTIAACAGLAAWGRLPTSPAQLSAGSFQLLHDGRVVRCLFRASAPTTVPPLVVVLLHGAGADASQWIDIGLATAVDAVASGHPTSLVAVAPDLTSSGVPALILDAVVPAVEERFAQHGALAISGISRGAGQALQTLSAAPRRFSSLGLHSPAVPRSVDSKLVTVPVFIDAGDEDALAAAARQLADELTTRSVPVTTQWPAGGHNRPYWRAQLRSYLEFHLATHETTT